MAAGQNAHLLPDLTEQLNLFYGYLAALVKIAGKQLVFPLSLGNIKASWFVPHSLLLGLHLPEHLEC